MCSYSKQISLLLAMTLLSAFISSTCASVVVTTRDKVQPRVTAKIKRRTRARKNKVMRNLSETRAPSTKVPTVSTKVPTKAPTVEPTARSPDNFPTPKPVTPFACQDIRTKVEINGKDRNCRWIATHDPVERCADPNVEDACPVTCGKPGCVPFDDPDTYWLNGKRRNCNFAIRKNPQIRCIKNLIRSNCPVACKDYLFYEEGPPCQDTIRQVNVNGQDRNCRWVATHKPEEKCALSKDVADKCPATCRTNNCVPFDNADKFWLNGRFRGCNFAKKNSETRCLNNIIRSKCPVTCRKYYFA